MENAFLSGFADELVKEGAHPLLQSVQRGGTMLGQKVKSMAKRVVKRGRGLMARTKGGTGLKGVAKIKAPKIPKMKKKSSVKLAQDGENGEGDSAEDAGAILRAILEEAQARTQQGYQDEETMGVNEPSYGHGGGMKPKKKPMAYGEGRGSY